MKTCHFRLILKYILSNYWILNYSNERVNLHHYKCKTCLSYFTFVWFIHIQCMCTMSWCLEQKPIGKILDKYWLIISLAWDYANKCRNVTLDLVCKSIQALHTTICLVAAVLAVGVSITPPLGVDALSRGALHLTGWALGWRCWVTAAASRWLIGLIL